MGETIIIRRRWITLDLIRVKLQFIAEPLQGFFVSHLGHFIVVLFKFPQKGLTVDSSYVNTSLTYAKIPEQFCKLPQYRFY